ncbi:hypothetical protein [Roseateles chitinivorans]|uniref:hypothetical protein n=1 Tax=Roseateles chitinivorans TaxID=2917965 RepID=UPI003D67E554
MPFFRNSPQAQPYEHTSIDLDDFEVIIGRKDGQDLEVEQLEFINGIVERAHRTKTAFSTHFSPLNLTERHVASEDPAFKAMCSRGIELLGVDPDADDGAIALAARRAADSAEAFLRTPAAGDTRLGRYAREVRLRARETLAERILRTPQPMGGRVRITSRSDEFALTTRERARLMAECFGVHRGPDVPGVDFILDARGKVAYAFKPMTEAAPRAVCRSRLHVSMSRAISKGSIEAEIASHPVPAVIVSMPGRWGTVATSAHPERDIEEAEETLGLLMIAPPGFDLCLASADDEREHGTEAGGVACPKRWPVL